MPTKQKYLIYTFLLTAGLMIFLHGSRMIIHTYQRESIHIETVKIGHRPEGDYEDIAIQRGLKDGLLDILVQMSGIGIALTSGTLLCRIKG